jgi:hypothetical protein
LQIGHAVIKSVRRAYRNGHLRNALFPETGITLQTNFPESKTANGERFMSQCVALKLSRVAGCLILLLVAAPFLSAQNVINVPADQPTIQAPINAANNGDTVLVAPGKYVENINFGGKAITVTGSGGPSVTTIDGGAKGSVVTFNSSETASSKLNGFTITDGLQNGYWGGGIFIAGASPTITGNVITGNHAAVGIGIYVNGGSPLIQNNTITGNDQKGAGDGGEGGGGFSSQEAIRLQPLPKLSGIRSPTTAWAWAATAGEFR